MYASCLRCDRSLGHNSEIKHLTIGRRVAFESATGRAWVICPACEQWNLIPIEERWEIVEECKKLASTAESISKGKNVGFARTRSGLELLSLDGRSTTRIANWRYGNQLQHRQFSLRSKAKVLVGIAAIGGLISAIVGASLTITVYATIGLAVWLLAWWRNPPRISVVVRTPLTTLRVWPPTYNDIHFEGEEDEHLAVVVGGQRLRGAEAAMFLSGFLSQINGPDCVDVSVRKAVRRVTAAERISLGEVYRGAEPGGSIKRAIAEARLAHLRPWEIIASENLHLNLVAFDPESRVALEMAATEEAEQIDLSRQAREMETSVRRERKVAAIADDLLLPDEIQRKLVALRLAEGRDALDPDEQVDHPAETQVSTLSENQYPMPTYKQPPTTFEELIAPFPARVRESATTLRTLILEAMPEAQESVSGGQSFGTALYSLVTPTNVACGLQPASSHCKLYLHHLQPDDAAGLKLEGSGKNVRHVKVHSPEAAQQVEIAAAIARAWLRAGVK